MADRYQYLTSTPVGKFLVKNLGLPNPVPLHRYTEGSPVLSGTFLVGGDGPLATTAAAAVTAAGGTAERAGSDEISAVYEQNRQDALAADVFGSPGYVLDGEVFWGQDRIELLADALKSGRAPYRSQV